MKVVAVDDERDLHILYEHFFEPEITQGIIEFQFFHSAKKCLNEVQDKKFILLTDINMPEMNGLELIQKFIEQGQQPVSVLITANPERHPVDLNSVFRVVSKPVDFKLLKELVRDLVNQ